MNVNEAFDVLEKSVMYPQRVQACEWLNAGGFPPAGEVGTALAVIPAGWLSNPPPECVVQALAAAGFGLHWASHAPRCCAADAASSRRSGRSSSRAARRWAVMR